MVSVNFAANAVPINNITTGEISDLYPSLFTPAGFTFAIWGVIYLGLLAFCIYQARGLFGKKEVDMPFVGRIGWLFFISCLLNSAWIFAWHYLQTTASMVIMILLLVTLIRLYHNLGIGQAAATRQENFWVRIPFRIYLGWITAATIANASIWLIDHGWDGWGLTESCWTILVIGAAGILTFLSLRLRRDLAFAAVILWALFGIVFERLTTEPVIMTVVVAAVAAMLAISAFAGLTLIQPERSRG